MLLSLLSSHFTPSWSLPSTSYLNYSVLQVIQHSADFRGHRLTCLKWTPGGQQGDKLQGTNQENGGALRSPLHATRGDKNKTQNTKKILGFRMRLGWGCAVLDYTSQDLKNFSRPERHSQHESPPFMSLYNKKQHRRQ